MYGPEIKTAILERVADGESLKAICEQEGMPNRETVRLWLRDDPEFLAEYARAKEEQAETLVEQFADIEDRVLTGELKPDAAKVVLWSRQWRAEKLKPRVYGSKVEHTGPGGGPVQHTVKLIFG
jgi:hypothetical protein